MKILLIRYKDKFVNKLLLKLAYLLRNLNVILVSNDNEISTSAKLYSAKITGDIHIGEKAKVRGGVTINGGSRITIGKYSAINGPNTDIVSKINPVSIGSFTSIARNVSIQEFNHKFQNLSTAFVHQNVFNENNICDIYSNGPIEIGCDVWVGTQCVILSGAHIGHGAVIAANSVVSGQIPPYAIAGGSPAKVIKYRFEDEVIKKLLELKWWDWPIEKMEINKEIFSKDVNLELLQKIEL